MGWASWQSNEGRIISWAKKTSRPTVNKDRLLGCIKVERKTWTNLHTVAKTDLQHAIDLNKTPGQAYHSIANNSRKLNGFAARLVKREPGISYTQGYTEVWDSVCVCWVAQLHPILCKPLDYSPPGFSVHGIFQARILECVAVSFSRGSSRLRDQILISCVSRIAGRFFTCWANSGGSLGSNKFWCEWEVKELWNFLNTINSCIWEKADDFLKAFAKALKCLVKLTSEAICSWTLLPWESFDHWFSLLTSNWPIQILCFFKI